MHIIDRLVNEMKQKGNPICVGVDPDLKNIPKEMTEIFFRQFGMNPMGASKVIFQFCAEIIDAVADIVPAVKFQMAYFEQFGYFGLKMLQKLVAFAREKRITVILD